MEVSDLQIYIALTVGSVAVLTTGISGMKYFYNRYTKGLDNKIAVQVDLKTKLLVECCEKVKKLEQRFDDFWRYFKHAE